MGNVLKSLAKNVLIPLWLTAAATDAAMHKKMFRSSTHLLDLAKRTTLIISNQEMYDIMKIIKSLEEFGLLIKALVKQLKMKQKNKKDDLLECY